MLTLKIKQLSYQQKWFGWFCLFFSGVAENCISGYTSYDKTIPGKFYQREDRCFMEKEEVEGVGG